MNAKNKYGMTALLLAAFYGHTDAVRVLLDGGADVNAKSKKGMTALSSAQSNGHTAVVQLLKKAGAME